MSVAWTPASDTRSADWLVSAVTTFAESVLSIVPGGFESYVRLFHPALRRDGDVLKPVDWATIAAARGKTAHPLMQFTALLGDDDLIYKPLPGVYDAHPQVGSLPEMYVQPLVTSLGCHTATPDRCWFAEWVGFGEMEPVIRSAPIFDLPNREYHLLTGPIEAFATGVARGFGQSANIWWPDDRSWCVATEIDFETTYIGCSADCRDTLLANPKLEAAEVEPSAGITFASDPVNT